LALAVEPRLRAAMPALGPGVRASARPLAGLRDALARDALRDERRAARAALNAMRRAILCTADAVEEAFYDAMQRGDLEAMMALWADDEDVLCIHPGSDRFIGLSAVRASWERIFRHGHVEIRRTDVQAHTGAVLAIHHVTEQTLALDPHGAGSGLQIVRRIPTNLAVTQAHGWRLTQPHPADAEKLH